MAIGAIAMYVLTLTCSDKQIADLKHYADSVGVVAETSYAQASHFSDSIQTLNHVLANHEGKVITVVRKDQATADSLAKVVASAHTVRDSNVALVQEVASLQQASNGLVVALKDANERAALETQRADSLQRSLDVMRTSVAAIVNKTNQLRGTPTWLRVSFEALKIGGAAYAGFKLGQHH